MSVSLKSRIKPGIRIRIKDPNGGDPYLCKGKIYVVMDYYEQGVFGNIKFKDAGAFRKSHWIFHRRGWRKYIEIGGFQAYATWVRKLR